MFLLKNRVYLRVRLVLRGEKGEKGFPKIEATEPSLDPSIIQNAFKRQ